MNTIITLAIIFALFAVIVIANIRQAQTQADYRDITILLLIILLACYSGIFLFLWIVISDNLSHAAFDNIDTTTALSFFIVSLGLTTFGLGIVFSRRLRVFTQTYLIRSDHLVRRYHPDSIVHSTAIVLMIFLTILIIGLFILSGGIEGMAESVSQSGFDLIGLLTQFLGFVLAAFLGVGIFVRRGWHRTLKRLGIYLPESNQSSQTWFVQAVRNLLIGAIVGYGLFWCQVSLSIVWQLSVSPETLAEQTEASRAIFELYQGSLWLGLLMALSAGICEELIFRGALQPIFGNVITSLFFVVLHTQYALNPASFIILFVSLALGFLRTQYSTPSAMMAHFVYNLTPFILIEASRQLDIPLEAMIMLGLG